MAKLPPFEIRRRDDEIGIDYCESFTPKVDRNGVFSVTLPEHLKPIYHKLGEKARDRFQSAGYAEAVSNTLDAIKRALRECCDEYHKCVIVDEEVILYNFTRQAHYVVSDDGRVFPEGNAATQAGYRYGERAMWAPELNGRGFSPTDPMISALTVGFAARVELKRTLKRATADTVTYLRWEGEGKYGRALNSFVHVALSERRHNSSFYEPKHGVREMPYTEEAAKFFADSMLNICTLAEGMRRFFGCAEALQKAIENNAPFALPLHTTGESK